MTELADMRMFVEVADHGGFTRAAERIGLSKSVVSRRIARMEADLGVRLISRTTRGISLTDAGVDFRGRCERILAEYDEAREAVARQGNEIAGRLRLTAPMTFGMTHVASILAELACRHPRLEIDASFTDRIVDIVGERFDLAIRIGDLEDSTLVARRIAPMHAQVVASPAYLERRGRPACPADIAEHVSLIYTGVSSPDWRFRVGRKWVSVRPSGRLRTDNSETLVKWAEAGLGLANLPIFLIGESIASGALVPLLPEYPQPEFGLYILRPPGRIVTAKVRALTDHLVDRLKACGVRAEAEAQEVAARAQRASA